MIDNETTLLNSLFKGHNFSFLVLHFSPRNEKLKKNENEKLSFSLQPIIAILDSLIGMILVNSHIWYLSWKNDSASMLDFVQQPKYVQNWGNEENYLMLIFLILLGTQNWVLYTRIHHYLIIGTCFLFPRTCQAI